ncbi:MAG: hypothetical protein K2Y16_06165 [Burkholderiales bacterium]|nr:hypothetical protein [Burkholderiales bacterium]
METTDVRRPVAQIGQEAGRNAMPLRRRNMLLLLSAAIVLTLAGPALGDGDAKRGARVFQARADLISFLTVHSFDRSVNE